LNAYHIIPHSHHTIHIYAFAAHLFVSSTCQSQSLDIQSFPAKTASTSLCTLWAAVTVAHIMIKYQTYLDEECYRVYLQNTLLHILGNNHYSMSNFLEFVTHTVNLACVSYFLLMF